MFAAFEGPEDVSASGFSTRKKILFCLSEIYIYIYVFSILFNGILFTEMDCLTEAKSLQTDFHASFPGRIIIKRIKRIKSDVRMHGPLSSTADH